MGWEAIRAEVLRRIRTRDWAPGGLIPSEEALAQEFGCARATVNRALQELANKWSSKSTAFGLFPTLGQLMVGCHGPKCHEMLAIKLTISVDIIIAMV